jgi:hypothetical protein
VPGRGLDVKDYKMFEVDYDNVFIQDQIDKALSEFLVKEAGFEGTFEIGGWAGKPAFPNIFSKKVK